MAKRVKVAGISGNTVITADGQRLRIIGNARPGGYVYTDGVVAYGYSLPGAIIKKPAKRIPTGYPLYDVGGYYDEHWRYLGYLQKPYNDDVTLFDFDNLENPVLHWYGRPAFFNDGENFYSLRGSWENPVLYSSASKKKQDLQGRKLFLGYIPGLGQVWQSGNLCETFSNIAAKTYRDYEYDYEHKSGKHYRYYYMCDKQSNTPGQIRGYYYGWSSYVTYSLQGNNLSDLTIEYENGSIAVSPIVNDILDKLCLILDAAADESIPAGEPTTPYPAARPYPAVLAYSLAGKRYNGYYSYPPCDSITAQGGCPLYDVDFSKFTEFNGRDMSDASKNYKVIHDIRKISNGIVFELFLIGKFSFYKYYETLTPSSSEVYDPPLPDEDGCYCWRSLEVGYCGRWRVTVTGSSAVLEHIEQEWDAYPFYYNLPSSLSNKRFANTLDFGNGWVFDTYESTPGNESGRVRRLGTNGEADVTYPENYTYVKDIVKIGNKECLVFAPHDGGICHYVNDALVDTGVSYNYSANDSFVVINKPNRLLDFYNRLANVPYYELDS